MDSNHRRHCQQIYSLSPLATREFPHIDFLISLVSPSRAQCSGSARKRKTERADTKLSPPRRKRSAARFVCRWSWWTDSNPRPADYKSAALPAELHQHLTGLIIIANEHAFVNNNFSKQAKKFTRPCARRKCRPDAAHREKCEKKK